jgi:hypothetical protein
MRFTGGYAMSATLIILLLLVMVLVTYAAITVATWLRLRSPHIVSCPENHEPATVSVDVPHAVLTALWEAPELRLQSCSRWPEHAKCKEECVTQIAEAPDNTRATSLLRLFFAGKQCMLCHREIPPVRAGVPKPGFLNAISHEILAWESISPRELSEIFRTHLPICSNCQILETFRHEHPDLVVDRLRTAEIQRD